MMVDIPRAVTIFSSHFYAQNRPLRPFPPKPIQFLLDGLLQTFPCRSPMLLGDQDPLAILAEQCLKFDRFAVVIGSNPKAWTFHVRRLA